MRFLLILLDYGSIQFDGARRHYSLELKLMEIGSIVYSPLSLRHIASSTLNELLARMKNKAVFPAVFRNDEVIYIDKKGDPRNPIKFAATEVGRHRLPYFGMFGQVFMAFMSYFCCCYSRSPLVPANLPALPPRQSRSVLQYR